MLDGLKGKILKTRLHGFGDAIKKAYCATVYIVCETTEDIYSILIKRFLFLHLADLREQHKLSKTSYNSISEGGNHSKFY